MKRAILMTAAATALGLGAALADDRDDDTTQEFALSDFDRIEISGVYDLTVEVGGDYSVRLSGSAKELNRVEASVSDGVLDLSQKERRGGWGRKRHGIDATISLPALNGLDISGVVDATIDGVDADIFELEISGVGDVDISGVCDELDASVSGVGDLDADKLKCRVVDVSVSGVGDASVYASEEVDASVSGMGDIDVYGSPEKVSKSDSMFAEVTVH
jgi:hypothetical protein